MKKIKSVLLCLLCVAAMATMSLVVFACGDKNGANGDGIVSVTAIGYYDYDCVKLQAMAVEYDCDLTGADVDASTFKIGVSAPTTYEKRSAGNMGDILKIYVNDKIEISESGGSGKGKYVIIEVFYDWETTESVAYNNMLAASATQVKDIKLSSGTVIAANPDKKVSSKISAKSLNFVVPQVSGFKYYTNDAGAYGADGPALTVENCFNQQTGLYSTVNLSYALYVPEDWKADGTYAMVTLQNPAATVGTHPRESVLAYRSASFYASAQAQQLVKDTHGVDGLIVLVPVVTARVNDNGGTPAEYQAVVALWDKIIADYNVDTNYVYGSGESVGGMIVLETNRNRDNFFAGILLYNNQWGQDYYVDAIFMRGMVGDLASASEGAPMHYPRVDSNMTWNYHYDSNGEKVYEGHDPYNYFYLLSDDNIMVQNTDGGGLSNCSWNEMKFLYKDLAGYDLNQHLIDGSMTLAEINEDIEQYATRENDPLNINWLSYQGNAPERQVDYTYKWLLTQTRQSEMSRDKLDLNKPFEIAETQIKTADRIMNGFTNKDGSDIYYLTGKAGAGTQGYNSYWGNTYTVADANPGWLPEGMSWETGVTMGHIASVTAVGDKAIAIEYDTDMTGLIIRLKGNKVYNHVNGVYRDDEIVIDPFDFYDGNGKLLSYTVAKVYVNGSAAIDATQEAKLDDSETAKSGSGNYVIIEFNESIASQIVTVWQRATLRTNTVFANAMPWAYTAE